MKGAVGFLFFMLFLAGFALVMLQGRQTAESSLGPGAAQWVGVNWRPVSLGGDSVADDARLEVRFTADGRIEGYSGCNSFFGSIERASTGLELSPLAATRKACAPQLMALEERFLATLGDTTSIERSNEQLRFLNAAGEAVAELEQGQAVER